MADCLVGCLGQFQCGSLIKVPEYVSMAPFVKVGFRSISGPDIITVGNKSYPVRQHEAIIKSFEYGKSNGCTVGVEIFDEQGGAFTKFFEEMVKCIKDASKKYYMKCQWGWVGTDCDAPMEPITSPVITVNLKEIDVNFTQGKIKFTATGTDLMQHVFHARETDSFGGDKKQKLSLKDALRQLFQDSEPSCQVKFLRHNNSGGQPEEWNFQRPFGRNGPRDRWSSDNQNKLATAMEWLEPFRTDNNKGIIPIFDPESNTIVFWEDWTKDCNDKGSCSARSLGTFIVNGGRCSPVLDFSPKINWPAAFGGFGVGGMAGPATHRPATKGTRGKQDRPSGCSMQTDKAGVMQSIPLTSQAINAFGTEEALNETEKSQAAHSKANAIYATVKPIEAELRFVGPQSTDLLRKFCGVTETVGKEVAIVVVNPFHLVGGGNGDCPEWLAQPGCNDYLSNKNWLVKGCNHNITEGSYTITLNVLLPTPGVDLKPGTGLGGDGKTVDTC